MIELHEWLSLNWQDRAKLIAKFKIPRTINVKVVQVAPGVDVVEDDGVRDLSGLANLTMDDLNKALRGEEVPEPSKIVEKPKRVPRKRVVKKAVAKKAPRRKKK